MNDFSHQRTAINEIAVLIERASLNASFRARLMAAPREVLSEAGIGIADSVEIIVEEVASLDHIAFPARRTALYLPIPVLVSQDRDIDDSEMDLVTGGVLGDHPAFQALSAHLLNHVSTQGLWLNRP